MSGSAALCRQAASNSAVKLQLHFECQEFDVLLPLKRNAPRGFAGFDGRDYFVGGGVDD